MRIIRELSQLGHGGRGSAISIGKFDGVHRGHLAIIKRLKTVAAERNLASVVFTFESNPLQFFRPDICPRRLSSPEQRLEILSDLGLDEAVMVPFDEDFASLDAEYFVKQILAADLNARYVIVGADFRFGKGGAGNPELLRRLGAELGFVVEVVEDVIGDAGARVSSTMIRQALEAGDVTHATELLGRHPRVTGTVVAGDARGRELGFPTANVAGDVAGFVPADGVYAGWMLHAGKFFPSAISIGTNPTFEGERESRIEVYVLDHELALYGERVSVDFVQMLRPTLAFESVDELLTQMNADVLATREILGM